MDALEVISADTTWNDEREFLRLTRRDRDVRFVSTHATPDGPIYLSLQDIEAYKVGRAAKGDGPFDGTFLLWNSGIMPPLCWKLSLNRYASDWTPVALEYAMPHPRSLEAKLAVFDAFRRQPITEQLFRCGMVSRLLSPVIELSIKRENDSSGYLMITAEFSNYPSPVWLVWNAPESRWEQEVRDVEGLLERGWEQPTEFVAWQERLFGWIREHWAGRILEQESYRY